jgi:alpha-tubulin suppressor-like RCC1 family protein
LFDDQIVPFPVEGVSNFVSVAAGYLHVLALRADGQVFAWGLDNYGQLGIGRSGDSTNSPVQSLVLTQIVAIAAGSYHSVALDQSGAVWTWGFGVLGRLGNGGNTNVTAPAKLTGITNVIAIAAGYDHTIALTADRTVRTWGDNSSGQLGRSGNGLLPGQVPNLSNVVAIAAGEKFSLAATSNGQVYAWGDNGYGQLGTTGIASSSSPIRVAGISNAVLVSASLFDATKDIIAGHSLAVTVENGTTRYWAWGFNFDGQVGNGTNGGSVYAPVAPQFCTRCERCVQLGTSGVLTAQCTGTLVLYFNDQQYDYLNFSSPFNDNGTNSFTVTVDGFGQTNVPAAAASGVAVGIVTKGSNYTFSASGFCLHNINDPQTDANGNPTNGTVTCSSINITNAICPAAKCFSLVGKIQ